MKDKLKKIVLDMTFDEMYEVFEWNNKILLRDIMIKKMTDDLNNRKN